jgi:hypothetical protein
VSMVVILHRLRDRAVLDGGVVGVDSRSHH